MASVENIKYKFPEQGKFCSQMESITSLLMRWQHHIQLRKPATSKISQVFSFLMILNLKQKLVLPFFNCSKVVECHQHIQQYQVNIFSFSRIIIQHQKLPLKRRPQPWTPCRNLTGLYYPLLFLDKILGHSFSISIAARSLGIKYKVTGIECQFDIRVLHRQMMEQSFNQKCEALCHPSILQ